MAHRMAIGGNLLFANLGGMSDTGPETGLALGRYSDSSAEFASFLDASFCM